MRSFPHKPDEAVLGESLAAGRQTFEEFSDAPGKPSAYYGEASNLAFSLAGLTYAFEQPAAEVKSFAVHATRYALQAVACEDQMDPATYQRFLALSVWTSDANFVLARFPGRGGEIAAALATRGVHVRDRSHDHGCADCLRLTAGVVDHTRALLDALEEVL